LEWRRFASPLENCWNVFASLERWNAFGVCREIAHVRKGPEIRRMIARLMILIALLLLCSFRLRNPAGISIDSVRFSRFPFIAKSVDGAFLRYQIDSSEARSGIRLVPAFRLNADTLQVYFIGRISFPKWRDLIRLPINDRRRMPVRFSAAYWLNPDGSTRPLKIQSE